MVKIYLWQHLVLYINPSQEGVAPILETTVAEGDWVGGWRDWQGIRFSSA